MAKVNRTPRFRKITVLALFVLCAGTLLFPAIATADQWSPSLTVPPNSDGVSFVDNLQWSAISYIEANTGVSTNANAQVQCSTIATSGPCALNSPGTSGSVTALLPYCASPSSSNCVASTALGASSQSMVPSTFVSSANGPSTPGDPALKVPAGSTDGLWTNPLMNSGGTNSYATFVEAQFQLINGKVSNATLTAAIYPYKVIQGNYFPPFVTLSQGVEVVEGGEIECAFTYATSCGRLEDFPTGTQASLSIRVTNLVGGWFRGRLASPTISESRFDATSNLISISAGVVTVPTMSYVASVSQVQSVSSLGKFFTDLSFPPPPTAAGAYIPTYSPKAFVALSDIRDVASNTASGQMTVWNFGTLPPWSSNGGENKSCLNNNSQVEGIVTTNAMAYQAGPPSLSGSFFTYGVAGMHYYADGSTVEGTYDLVMRNSVAQCLYGFANAPISATVNITESSLSVENVATTSVQDANGWLHVGAYGFNFSNPIISVRLWQIKHRVTISCVKGRSVVKISGVSPRCPIGFKKLVTITCLKGTSTKKVTAATPRCPAGYKRR